MASASFAVPGPRSSSSVTNTMGDETKISTSTVTVALLVLACCHAALAVSNLSTPHDAAADDPAAAAARGVEPMGYLASMASTVVAAYVASAACGGSHGPGRRRRPRLENLLAEARRTWARPAATALYIELLTTAMASLLLTLRAFLGAAASCPAGAAVGLLTGSGSVALVAWLALVLFAHSDIACRMSLVVAVAEEEGYAGGAAVRRAEALVAGRSRARGLAVGLAAAAIEQVPAWLCGDGGAPAMVFGLAVLAAKIAACCVCAAFYYDCRRRHDRVSDGVDGALKLDEGMSKYSEIDYGWDMADECEAEEFWSVFEGFRLT